MSMVCWTYDGQSRSVGEEAMHPLWFLTRCFNAVCCRLVSSEPNWNTLHGEELVSDTDETGVERFGS